MPARQDPDDQGLTCTVAALAPTTDAFTLYDEAHLALYLSLLHASAEGVAESVMCRDILGIDAAIEPERAKTTLASHLARARWLSGDGSRHVLAGS